MQMLREYEAVAKRNGDEARAYRHAGPICPFHFSGLAAASGPAVDRNGG